MTTRLTPTPGPGTLGTGQTRRADTSPKYTIGISPSHRRKLAALVKTTLVWLLSWLLAWRPALAMRLGQLVTGCWPEMREV